MNMLVEWCKVKCKVEPKALGLPDDFDMLQPEEKMRETYRMLKNRADHGSLLVLLDNLQKNNLRLISEEGLTELNGMGVLPDDLHMIGTTRIKERIRTAFDVSEQMDIANLTEKDAIEFFCRVSEDIFPFAKYPMSNGKLLLVKQAKEDGSLSKAEKARINKDYAALKSLIEELKCHAWSLEIVAGYIISGQRSFQRSFQDELDSFRKQCKQSICSSISGKPHRTTDSSLGSAPPKDISAEMLLTPTFEQIRGVDDYVKGVDRIGEKILKLAQIASFFPPEQVPEEALVGIWIQEYGNGKVSVRDNGTNESLNGNNCNRQIYGKACDFAIGELKSHRIINGEGPLLKMHRITRDVLQKKLSPKNKVTIIKSMQLYLDGFLRIELEPTSQQLLPWCGWAEESLKKYPSLRKSPAFHETLMFFSKACVRYSFMTRKKQPNQDESSETISPQDPGIIIMSPQKCLLQSTERILDDLKTIYSSAQTPIIEKEAGLAKVNRCLGFFHIISKNKDVAEREFQNALMIYRELERKTPKKYLDGLASSLFDLTNVFWILNLYDKAATTCREALKYFRELADKGFFYKYIHAYILLATIHGEMERHQLAEKEFRKALLLLNNNAECYKSREVFLFDKAEFLVSISRERFALKKDKEATRDLEDALDIYTELARKNPGKYYERMTEIRGEIAWNYRLSEDNETAEKIYRTMLGNYRYLEHKSPGTHVEDWASTLSILASIHIDLGRPQEAEKEYQKGLRLLRKQAETKPDPALYILLETLESILYLRAEFDPENNSEKELLEMIDVYRKIEILKPKRYLFELAETLNTVADLHFEDGRYQEAEKEYSESIEYYRSLPPDAFALHASEVEDIQKNLSEIRKKTISVPAKKLKKKTGNEKQSGKNRSSK